jgi:hypothetical protein
MNETEPLEVPAVLFTDAPLGRRHPRSIPHPPPYEYVLAISFAHSKMPSSESDLIGIT